MDIAQVLHFARRHAFSYHLLFGLHDFLRSDVVEVRYKILPHAVQTLTVVEPLQVRLQPFGACRFHLEALIPENSQNSLHRYTFQPGSLWNGRHAAHGVQHHSLRYLREAQLFQDFLELRVFLDQFINSLAKIYLFHIFQ